ncbi:MAG TPA: chromosome partitioning protein ParB [Gammaproteobacteria bacterium]|nr:chromosome partitioning protein ParB [Gammaproteobacteria bacterium]
MATKKKAKKKAKKKVAARKTTRRKTARKKGKLSPRKEKQGLTAAQMVLDVADAKLATLVEEVQAAGGAPIGAYREPLSGRPILMAALPIKAVQPTPFQRDLSPTHVKRLAEKIEESGAFLDPLIVVRGEDGQLWTPNGRHRLAAAKMLGLRQITALVSPDEDLSFRILALNTEKAHNLKDKSLEVIRMARNLAERKARAKEIDYANEFEAPSLLTLGIIYADNKRFAGSAYNPFLRKVDRFSDKTLRASLRQREAWAARLLDIDYQVKDIIEQLKARGFKSPYLRNLVVARINPVRFHRQKKGVSTPPMSMSVALTRMAAAARKFDVSSVRPGDLALVAALSAE